MALVSGAPRFQSFSGRFAPILRDDQTLQFVAAADPISGEELRVEVALAVLKWRLAPS